MSDEIRYTVCCSVCGDHVQRKDLRRVPFCSAECRRYWNLDDEDKRKAERDASFLTH